MRRMNKNKRKKKPSFRRDWMREMVERNQREAPQTSWTRFVTEQYKNPRVRKGYNDAEDEYVRRGDPTYL